MRLDKSPKYFFAILCGLLTLIATGCGGNESPENELLRTRVFVPTVATINNVVFTLPQGGQIQLTSFSTYEENNTRITGNWQILNTDPNFANLDALEPYNYIYRIIDRNTASITFEGSNPSIEQAFFAGVFDGSQPFGGTTSVTLQFSTTNTDINDLFINTDIDIIAFMQTVEGDIINYPNLTSATLTTSGNTPVPTALGFGLDIIGDLDIPADLVGKDVILTIQSTEDFTSHSFPDLRIAQSRLTIAPWEDIDDSLSETAQAAAGLLTSNGNPTTPEVISAPISFQRIRLDYRSTGTPLFSDTDVDMTINDTYFITQTDSGNTALITPALYLEIGDPSVITYPSRYPVYPRRPDLEYIPDHVNDTAELYLGNGYGNGQNNTARSAVIRMKLTFTNSRGGRVELFYGDDNSNNTHFYENLLSNNPTAPSALGILLEGEEEERIDVFTTTTDPATGAVTTTLDNTYYLVSKPTNSARKFAEGTFNLLERGQ